MARSQTPPSLTSPVIQNAQGGSTGGRSDVTANILSDVMACVPGQPLTAVVGIYVTRISPGGPAEVSGLMMGDKIMQVNGWDMTMVTHDKARQKLTKNNKDVVRLLVTRKSLEEAVKHSMGGYPRQQHSGTYTNDTISKN
ncbi:hypothetical protein F2P81_005768 [Scophthalmus maximus]|uniref:Tax1-binding protein 3 n=1 Tax=Scophthalmus maximus TaxID=52904 RepID=A0A6A4T403_SCOMX|nr:hypothetical protein F2P81_005768 [Scophthalmus maximus]